ncbi:scavenger receptor class F member 1-like isoform X1 [Haliotis rufescens]|uniref:scavenger receptor class F member 1-like isoform X1 n=3 Tax=Haliotis rufescens TaxID=6454 RepID=UPI00201F6DD2|nr:scavenger receptor class F member 1-like isoform X1 [Haliotis rufescens]
MFIVYIHDHIYFLRTSMTELIMLFLMSTLVSAQAMNKSSVSPAPPCKENQHCSQCDSTTGYCLECTAGYYDTRCSSVCNKNCLKKKCTLSSNGNGNCTDGCVSGYQGTACNIPCDNPGGTCTACPGGCDGGYCQLGSSCMSGCVDSYYGTGCKTCSSRCKSCNRMTGECTECHAQYVGPTCECPPCNGTYDDCEMGGCKHASYGNDDKKTGSVLTWLLASLLLPVSGILLTLCLCYCKRFPKQREQEEHQDQMHQDEVEYLQYLPTVQGDILNTNRHSNHAYYDVIDGEKGPAIVFL